MKYRQLLFMSIVAIAFLSGCGHIEDNSKDTDAGISEDMSAFELSDNNTAADTKLLEPSDLSGYRRLSDELPEAGMAEASPGTREHFSFTDGDHTYVFTETETLWLYNQSAIDGLRTEFLLNVNGNKVMLAPLSAKEKQEVALSEYEQVYSDDRVVIYQGQRADSDGEGTTESSDDGSSMDSDKFDDERMYLTLYDIEYRVDGWQTLIKQGVLTSDTLYQELAQMGTAVQPATEGEALSTVLDGYRSSPVFEDYCFAYRKGITHTGFFYCSPNTNQAVYDNISIYMSIYIPDWDAYTILHIEPSPVNIDSLENTGEQYDGNPILADYAGSLKYYLIGEDGRCVYIEGVPGEAGNSDKAYTAKEAAYIYELVFMR